MKETLQFLRDLSKNNNKEWFDANKDRFLADGGCTASYWYGDLQYLKATH